LIKTISFLIYKHILCILIKPVINERIHTLMCQLSTEEYNTDMNEILWMESFEDEKLNATNYNNVQKGSIYT